MDDLIRFLQNQPLSSKEKNELFYSKYISCQCMHGFFFFFSSWINNPTFSVSNSLADVCFTASFKR